MNNNTDKRNIKHWISWKTRMARMGEDSVLNYSNALQLYLGGGRLKIKKKSKYETGRQNILNRMIASIP